MPLQVRLLLAAYRALAVAVGLLAMLRPGRWVPAIEWPRPRGDFRVGVRDLELRDPGQPAATRGLMARVWYPALGGSGTPRRLHEGVEGEAMVQAGARMLPAALLRRFGRTVTASQADAAPAPGRFPLLVFSHGLGGVVSQNTQLAEDLTSHGYVVCALAHPGGAAAICYPDGSCEHLARAQWDALIGDPEQLAADRALRAAADVRTRWLVLRRSLELEPLRAAHRQWTANITTAITRLAAREDLLAQVDFERIGALGMSFGGAASASAAHVDSRIRAAVNLDGGQRGDELVDRLIRVPLLLLHSHTAPMRDGGSYNDFHYEPWASAGCNTRVSRRVVDGAGHLSFTDLALFGRGPLHRLLGTAGIDGARVLALTADVTRRFFDRHLKQDASAFPDGMAGRWPELEAIELGALRRFAASSTEFPSGARP
jgi:predicted dienelactone hydrolase